jgi:hypothetical protein
MSIQVNSCEMNSTHQRSSVRKKRRRVDFFKKNSKNTMVLVKLCFLKLLLVLLPNSLEFLVLEYFYKTMVCLKTTKNTLYPNKQSPNVKLRADLFIACAPVANPEIQNRCEQSVGWLLSVYV